MHAQFVVMYPGRVTASGDKDAAVHARYVVRKGTIVDSYGYVNWVEVK
jgi:hypothetical protein